MRLRLGISFSSHIFNIHMGISISPNKSLVLLRIRLHPVLLKQVHPMQGNPETRKICLWNPESRVLESGTQLMESGIPLTIGIQNPSSTDKDLESSTWNLESTTWNPESKTILDSLALHEVNKCSVLATSLLKCSNLGKGIWSVNFWVVCIIHKLAPLDRTFWIIHKK